MRSFEILEWDSAFFGYPVAQIVSLENEWGEVLNSLCSEGVVLVYWPVEVEKSLFERFAKINNGILIDKKTTYSINFHTNNFALQNNEIEPYKDTEANAELLALSVQCGGFSRFKVDPKIANEKFEELYRLWMVQSVKRQMADDVLVYKINDQIVGVVTVYIRNGVGNIGLIGVDDKFRGQGIGKALINSAKAYFSSKNIWQIDVITQGMNRQACALYERTGFSIIKQHDYYHFWLK